MVKKEESIRSMRGYSAKIGKGLDSTSKSGESNVMSAPIYESIDTVGLGNITDYEEKKTSRLQQRGGG